MESNIPPFRPRTKKTPLFFLRLTSYCSRTAASTSTPTLTDVGAWLHDVLAAAAKLAVATCSTSTRSPGVQPALAEATEMTAMAGRGTAGAGAGAGAAGEEESDAVGMLLA